MSSRDILEADRLREMLLKGGLRKDFKQLEKQKKLQRREAEKERADPKDKKGSKPTFLRPQDIAGDYDFSRALKTTLGMPEGMTRALNSEDLKAFAANIEQMKSAYKGGITVSQVINLSAQDDIDRANKQIFSCVPASRKNGVVHFLTNASPNSEVSAHHVHVEFLAFNDLVFNPDSVKSTSVRNRLANGKVKIECDCGRFQYWYRYLNTMAGTVHGRKEGGFPKIRNPNLTGVACKHLIRVMHWTKSSIGQQYLANALEKDRTAQVGRRYVQSKNQMVTQLAQQVAKKGSARSQIKANLNAEIAKIEAKAKRQATALIKKQKEQETRSQALMKITHLLNAGVLTQEEFNVLKKGL